MLMETQKHLLRKSSLIKIFRKYKIKYFYIEFKWNGSFKTQVNLYMKYSFAESSALDELANCLTN